MDLDRHIGLGSLPVVIIGNPPGFREWISETPRFAIMDPEPDIGHGSLPPVIIRDPEASDMIIVLERRVSDIHYMQASEPHLAV